MPGSRTAEPPGGCLRTMRVTMGAVSTPSTASGGRRGGRRRPPPHPSRATRRAIDDLYERFRRPAFALARRILADDVLAEDVLQEVFLSVWRDPARLERGAGSFASWLLAVVHHKAVDAVRREESQRRRQARAEEDLALDEPAPRATWRTTCGRRVVPSRSARRSVRCPAPQREALTLAYFGGYTQREVAALTGAPLGTVKTRMLAGMRRLKEELGGAVAGCRRRPRPAPRGPADEPGGPRRARPSTSWPSAGRCTRSSPRTRRSSPPTCRVRRCARRSPRPPTSWAPWPPTCPPPSPPRGCATGSGPPSRRPSRCRGPARRSRRGRLRAAPAPRPAPGRPGLPAVAARPRPRWRRVAAHAPGRRRRRRRSSAWAPGTSSSPPPGTSAGDRRGAVPGRATRCSRPGQATSPRSTRRASRWPPSSPATTRSQVITQGLAVNDAARPTYVLWGMGDDPPAAGDLRRGPSPDRTCGP